MNTTIGAVLALFTAVAAPLGAYFIAYRRFSGRIQTTEASRLWDEAAAIREDYRRRVDECNERADRVEEENRRLRERVAHLEEELRKAHQRIDELAEGR